MTILIPTDLQRKEAATLTALMIDDVRKPLHTYRWWRLLRSSPENEVAQNSFLDAVGDAFKLSKTSIGAI